jgi:hypothetical protein
VKAIFAGAKAKPLEATYRCQMLPHATLEPQNCMAKVSSDGVDVWGSMQFPQGAQGAAAAAAGMQLEQVRIWPQFIGGGFGRRIENDYVAQAVAIAKEMPGTPVKLIWMRPDDMKHDFYRPISQCKLSAGLDADGKLVGLHVRVSGQSINATLNQAAIVGGKDTRQLQGFYEAPGDAQLGYSVPNLLIEYAMRNTHVPVGPWRGVNTNQNGVYMECFMDEVARAAGKDPLDCILDFALSENLETVFVAQLLHNDDKEVGKILADPNTHISLSDAGAHLTFFCDAAFGLHLLGHWSRDLGVLDLPQAVHRLSGQPAKLFGLTGRGLLREGYAADLMLFDKATVARGPKRRAHDLPAGAARLTTSAVTRQHDADIAGPGDGEHDHSPENRVSTNNAVCGGEGRPADGLGDVRDQSGKRLRIG